MTHGRRHHADDQSVRERDVGQAARDGDRPGPDEDEGESAHELGDGTAERVELHAREA